MNVIPLQIVLDTNVLVAALRSNRGASFQLLSFIGQSEFEINLSVPLVLEYEDVCKRDGLINGLSSQDVDDMLDYLCTVGRRRRIFYLWRPFLRDPKDDMVFELAVEAECQTIVSFNRRDFAGIKKFGLQIQTPREFLLQIGQL